MTTIKWQNKKGEWVVWHHHALDVLLIAPDYMTNGVPLPRWWWNT